ncbi:hypothetical protein [Streptomyces purpureus]|uniref:hypothetical protein n=1 Tax=Streptomyces purpureus TaxID=1951 RepID=UPI001FD2A1F2|nr:hypothetical protein [Streptomyces purpureus]
MSEVKQAPTTIPWQHRWGRQPRIAGGAALGWAVVQSIVALACVWAGTSGTTVGGDQPPVGLAWFAAGVAVLGGVSAAAAVRGHEGRTVRGLLWAACALSTVTGFSLLMDVVGLLFAHGVDNVAAAVLHTLGLLGAVLLAATSHARRPAICARCGTVHTAVVRPHPSHAPRRVRLVAYGGILAFVPYIGMKMVWALGGTFAGISGAELLRISERNGASGVWLTLESWGVDGTVLLAALGIFLLFGLIRPWGQIFPRWTLGLSGRSVPRWLPLAPALIGATTLVPYGLGGVGYLALVSMGAASMRLGDSPTLQDALLMGWVGHVGFAVYGLALLTASRSYWLRTRPVC